MKLIVSNFLSAFRRRPVIILPIVVFINLIFIHLYGIPIFDQQAASGERMKAFVATRDTVQSRLDDSRRSNNERLQNISHVCERYNKDEDFRKLTMSGTALATSDKRLFYCSVPKVGCTFWKRVFRFIGNDYKGHFKSPESIPRLFVHEGPYRNTTVILLKNDSEADNLDYSFRFMFTRDPYARLWSGYLDKLYLPDFWWWLGVQIVNTTRPDADIRSLKCGYDVTFEEFLSYTVVNLQSGFRVDNHFAPIYTQCNPCAIKFDIIGKLETFGDDSRLVLEETNANISDKHKANNKDIVLEEVQTLLKYNFDVLEKLKQSSGNADCYNPLSIAKRLWKTFQYHGYISDMHKFPSSMANFPNDLMILRKALLKQIVYLRHSAGNEVEIWKSQRQKYLDTAYNSISQKILIAIGHVYKGDFELFGYKKRTFHMPSELKNT